MKVIVRGGGDLATGVVEVLHTSGFKVLILEIEKPSAIRRTVAFSEAIYDGETKVENIVCRKVENENEIYKAWEENIVPIMIDEDCKIIEKIKPNILVDCIIAKKNLGTKKEMAPITIGLGPGFIAGKDVDIVVETMRGHKLGRIIREGEALKNTGIPGEIKGVSKERVIYSPKEGIFRGVKKIGDRVEAREILGYVDREPVYGTISGVLRGLIRDGYYVKDKMKIGDIDPREEEKENCFTISDKARTLGGAVLHGIMIRLKEKNEKIF